MGVRAHRHGARARRIRRSRSSSITSRSATCSRRASASARTLGVADGSAIRFTGFVTPDASSPALDAVARRSRSRATNSIDKAITFAGASIPAAAKHVNLSTLTADGMISSRHRPHRLRSAVPLHEPHILQVAGPQNDPVGATLTIHEGVTLQMNGALIVGRSAARRRATSSSPAPRPSPSRSPRRRTPRPAATGRGSTSSAVSTTREEQDRPRADPLRRRRRGDPLQVNHSRRPLRRASSSAP